MYLSVGEIIRALLSQTEFNLSKWFKEIIMAERTFAKLENFISGPSSINVQLLLANKTFL